MVDFEIVVEMKGEGVSLIFPLSKILFSFGFLKGNVEFVKKMNSRWVISGKSRIFAPSFL